MCGTICCKYLLFSINLFVALSSFAVLTLAVTELVAFSPYFSLEQVQDAPKTEFNLNLSLLLWIIIGVAIFAFIVSLLGCCGVISGSPTLLGIYVAILIIIVILECGIIIAGWSMQDTISEEIESKANASLPFYLTLPEAQRFWDALQADLLCCGLQSPSDWHNVFKNDTLPLSCCPSIPIHTACTIEETTSTEGCLDTILTKLQTNTDYVYMVIGIIAFIELLGVTLGCCLCCCLRNSMAIV